MAADPARHTDVLERGEFGQEVVKLEDKAQLAVAKAVDVFGFGRVGLPIKAQLTGVVIAIFLLPTAVIMHAFWKESDATAKQNESIAFFKDLSLAGAALIIFALLRGGADFGSNVGTLLFFS